MNTKVNSSMLGVPLAVEINALTDCLVHRLTGEIYETEMCRLFAFACKRSVELGFEGFVAFQAKTRLIRHYQEKLHAVLLDGKGRMAIDENAAKRLVSTYFEGR